MSVRTRGTDHKQGIKDSLRQIAERVATEGVVSATNPSGHTRGRLAMLAQGKQRSNPNHHLLATALRFVPKGRETFVGCILRAARNGDTEAETWMRVFDELLPSQQTTVDFDDVCEACGVTPDHLMAIAVSTMMKMGSDTAEFVSAVFHPKIVHQTAKSAMRIGGENASVAQRDRELMLQHAKFIAGPKGVNVNVSAQANAAAAAQAQPSVPTFAESVMGAQQAHIGVHRKIAANIVEAEVAE